MQSVQNELTTTKKEAKEAAALAKTADEARKALDKKLATASDKLAETEKEMVVLTKAKTGIEELFFEQGAEIRKLKGELRKMQASRDKSSKTPTPGQEAEGETDRATAQAFAD